MLLCVVCTAWAGNDRDAEKIRLVEKIYREQGFMKYASPEFKRIVRKGEKIAYRDEPMGCELFEHYQLGFSNGDSEVPWVRMAWCTRIIWWRENAGSIMISRFPAMAESV